jgi:crotonobetainyl-CoA:carnitine CoA-transferase CaiB-like acyl-CoA transferase
MPALDGVRVLELGDWVAGPFACGMLADFGAEVVRVEVPHAVANTRQLGGLEPEDPERSPYFAVLGRNKRSVTLDLKQERGRELLLELVRRSDAMVESFRPGSLERWGLGWDRLEVVNPRLVLLRISGYGQTGPWKERPGFDRVAQAFGGMSYLTGAPDGPPVRAGLAVADYGTGIVGALGVMLALFERERSGRGQVIDHALYETLVPMIGSGVNDYTRHGKLRGRTGNRYPGMAPGDAYQTADGAWVQISASGDVAYERLMAAIGRAELASDERYDTVPKRIQREQELVEVIGAWVRTKTADEAESELERAGVACSRMMSVADLLAHPQVEARQNLVPIPDPAFGEVWGANVIPRLSRTPGTIRHTAPRVGADNEYVYGELLGIGAEELSALGAAGVI